jgi:CheY-like chemotaxis protein
MGTSLLILVIDDESDVEALFRQHLRRDPHAGRYNMQFAYSASAALDRIENAAEASLVLILTDIKETKRKALENGAEALLTKPIGLCNAPRRGRSVCGSKGPHSQASVRPR